jgi:hypothetical protein
VSEDFAFGANFKMVRIFINFSNLNALEKNLQSVCSKMKFSYLCPVSQLL